MKMDKSVYLVYIVERTANRQKKQLKYFTIYLCNVTCNILQDKYVNLKYFVYIMEHTGTDGSRGVLY